MSLSDIPVIPSVVIFGKSMPAIAGPQIPASDIVPLDPEYIEKMRALAQEVEADIKAVLREPEAPIAPPQGPRLVKLARSGMRSYAHRLLREQGGLCPLCRKAIDLTEKGEGVIDHDHDTGRIRGLLHRSCNAAEGKIANAAARWGAKSSKYSDIIPYLSALVAYLTQEPTTMIYPMHKTPDEKRDARLAKAREARAAIKAKRVLAQQKRQGA